MNVGIFTGRLGRDSELNKMSNGDPVANFPVAVDVGTKDNPKTMWVDCALFGKRAEALQKYLIKGLKTTVHGRVILDTYASKDGTQKSTMRLTVSEIDLHLAPKDRAADGGQEAGSAKQAKPVRDEMGDDIPF